MEYQTVGGGWVSSYVVWGTTTVTGKVYTKTGLHSTAQTTCMDLQVMPNTAFDVVRKIILPETEESVERKYTFTYNSDSTEQTNTPSAYYCGEEVESYTRNASIGWGELSEITTPTGAQIEYARKNDGTHDLAELSPVENPWLDELVRNQVETKAVTHDGVTDTWNYNYLDTYINYDAIRTSSSAIGPDGSGHGEYYFPTNVAYGCCGVYSDAMRGRVVKTIESGGILKEKSWMALGGMVSSFGSIQTSAANAVVDTEYTTLLASDGTTRLKISAKKFEYDYNGEVTKIIEYDWFNPGDVTFTDPPGVLYQNLSIPAAVPETAQVLRVTDNTHYNQAANSSSSNAYHKRTLGTTPVILGKSKSSVVSLSSTVKARTEFYYDGVFNLTETRVWDSTKGAVSDPLTGGNSISTFAEYAANGNVTETTDANENITTIAYGCVDGASSCDSEYENLYPTQTVVASGTPVARTSSTKYDFFTGLPLSVTDEDNDLTNSTEYDILGRPTKAITADGEAGFESWTVTDYHDEDRFIVVKSDLETVGDGKKVAIQHYDMLGRVKLSRTLENPDTEDPTDPADGIKVETKYDMVSGYNYQLTSNPYRTTSDPTMGWTRSKTWSHGRKSEVETFSGSALPAPRGSNESSTGKVTTDIDANRTLVTDQAGKQRISVSNALGQLKEVWEILAASETGSESIAFPSTSIAHGFKTTYSYNTLGKLVDVHQGAQHRYFMYDSLGRMLRVRQPEQDINTALNTSGNPDNNSWTAGFTYDNNGNVLTATDAKNVTITNTYDALNRALTRTYSDGTPTVTNTYDDSGVAFSKGKLTKVSSSISETRYTEFDEQGRLVTSEQRTDGEIYPSEYKYNLAGILTEQKYPSGRVVKNIVDSSGDIASISSKTATKPFNSYASNFEYTASGVIKHLKLGNGLWESAVMNSRNQILELRMGTSSTDGSQMHLTYEYGEFDGNGDVDATKNAGNIATQTINFTGLANPFVQKYKYDSLDRITEAKETVNGSQTWIQTFGYDRYGNRTSHAQTLHGQAQSINEETLPAIDANTNRFSNTTDYEFDEVGNLIRDIQGRQFTFNGDNKQIEVKNDQDATIGEYKYDGLGKRIKKETATEYVIFVYDGLGKLIGEYATDLPSAPIVSFTATDPLGSPRVLTNENGEVLSRRDFMPFGEEIVSESTYRTTARKYGIADSVRQKFTGYLRDDETALDFAEARYYHNNHGRFTAVDPLLASGKSADPQTFNRYTYTMNRPLILTDSTGLQSGQKLWIFKTVGPNDQRIWERAAALTEEKLKAGFEQLRRTFETTIRGGPNDGRPVTFFTNGTFQIHPLENPVGYEVNEVRKGVEAIGQQIQDAVYAASPDYCKVQVSAPLVPIFEGAASKDFRIYSGGGISNALLDFSFMEKGKNRSYRFSASLTCGFFLERMRVDERHNAMTGTSVSGSVNPGTPWFHFGGSQSLPLFQGPTAIEVGVGPNTGGSATNLQEFSFGEWMKGRKPNEQQ